MTRARRARLSRAYFRAMHRLMATRSSSRFEQLYRLASTLAERLAGLDRPSLFDTEVA